MERVPAGARFKHAEMILSLYEIHLEDGTATKASEDLKRLSLLLEAMQLVEDDYIGGLGSRGSGKVAFREIKLSFRQDAKAQLEPIGESHKNLTTFAEALDGLIQQIGAKLVTRVPLAMIR
jgi:CRISPR-associated protein Csm3